ncbi:hypothetical protein BT69DRAFT_1277935 [Atractiella rhizophila]|nr:hypothetical protein BT69DRAFT_1277935 [Atractiella rhizophila]
MSHPSQPCRNCLRTGAASSCYFLPRLLDGHGREACVPCMGRGIQCEPSDPPPPPLGERLESIPGLKDFRSTLLTSTNPSTATQQAIAPPWLTTGKSRSGGNMDLSPLTNRSGVVPPPPPPPSPPPTSPFPNSLRLENRIWTSSTTSLDRELLQPNQRLRRVLEKNGYILTRKSTPSLQYHPHLYIGGGGGGAGVGLSAASTQLLETTLRQSLSYHLVEESFREVVASTFLVRGSYVTSHSSVLGPLALGVPPVLAGDLVKYGESRMTVVHILAKRMMDLARERGVLEPPTSLPLSLPSAPAEERTDVQAQSLEFQRGKPRFETILVLVEIVGILLLLGHPSNLKEAKQMLHLAYCHFITIWDSPSHSVDEKLAMRDELALFLYGRDVDVAVLSGTVPCFTDKDVARVFDGHRVKAKYLLFPDGLMLDKRPEEMIEDRSETIQMVRYCVTRTEHLTALASPHLHPRQLSLIVRSLWNKVTSVYDWLEAHHRCARLNPRYAAMGPVAQEPDWHVPTRLEAIDRCLNVFRIHVFVSAYSSSLHSHSRTSPTGMEEEMLVEELVKESEVKVQEKIGYIAELMKEDMLQAPLANTLAVAVRRFALSTLEQLPGGPRYLKKYVLMNDGRSAQSKLEDIYWILQSVLPLGWFSPKYKAWRSALEEVLTPSASSKTTSNSVADGFFRIGAFAGTDGVGEERDRWEELKEGWGSCLPDLG